MSLVVCGMFLGEMERSFCSVQRWVGTHSLILSVWYFSQFSIRFLWRILSQLILTKRNVEFYVELKGKSGNLCRYFEAVWRGVIEHGLYSPGSVFNSPAREHQWRGYIPVYRLYSHEYRQEPVPTGFYQSPRGQGHVILSSKMVDKTVIFVQISGENFQTKVWGPDPRWQHYSPPDCRSSRHIPSNLQIVCNHAFDSPLLQVFVQSKALRLAAKCTEFYKGGEDTIIPCNDVTFTLITFYV